MNTFPVLIEQSRNRSSRAVFRDDAIVIRLAKNLPPRIAQEHIASLTRRMQRLALREGEKRRIDPFRPLLEGAPRLTVTLGSGALLTVERLEGTRKSLQQHGDVWTLRAPADADKRMLHRLLWKALGKRHLQEMHDRVTGLNEGTFRFPLHAVRLKHTKTQWGSCGARGQICLNTALLFVPPRLLDYVIIHELAHLRHRNHGARFWGAVAAVCPAFREAVKELRSYRIVVP